MCCSGIYINSPPEHFSERIEPMDQKHLDSSQCSHGFILISILFFWNENSFEKCGTLHIISITNGFITLDNLALISFVKCYLARKTAQLEGINVFLVIGLGALIYVGEYALCIGMEVATITSFTVSCLNDIIEKPEDEDKYLKGLKLFKMLATLGIGIASDVSLFMFLKKKNQVQPAIHQDQLVPWKSSNEKDYNYHVPIGASTIAMITAFVIGFLFTALSSRSFRNAFDLLYPMSFLLPTLLLATMLGLTIRTAWNQKPKPQIPQGPCFHDQIEKSEDNIELIVAEINIEVELPNAHDVQSDLIEGAQADNSELKQGAEELEMCPTSEHF